MIFKPWALPTLTARRLALRQWQDDDLAPFRDLNADPRVMQHFPNTLAPEQSDDLALRIRKALAEQDFGFWAVEAPGVSKFIALVGLGCWRPGRNVRLNRHTEKAT
jgi:RimJ/RimL family protein N-acetyltransferase